jgi:acyl-CoA synthetase (NDP forming)
VAAAEALVSGRSTHGKPVLVLAPGGVGPEEEPRYAAAGIPVVRDTDVLMGAVAALGAAAEPAPATPDPVVPQDLGPVDEVEGTRLLAAAGVPMAELAVADSADEAVAHAERIGWPVVLKGVVAGVAHKSDLGLVVVGVADAQRARAEATRLFGVGASAVTVQPVVRGALEALAGIVTEPGLGRFLVVGLGGVHAEALADLAMVPVGAGRAELREAVQRTRLGAVLRSPRWGAPGAVDALVGVLDRLAAFARAHGPALEAVDINPLLLDGEAVVGVDALVVRAAPAAEVLA